MTKDLRLGLWRQCCVSGGCEFANLFANGGVGLMVIILVEVIGSKIILILDFGVRLGFHGDAAGFSWY